MPWHQVPFSAFPCAADAAFPQGHLAKRPLVRVDLSTAQGRLPCYAIVDSGADHCTFPLSFALPLGLDPRAMASSNTAGVGGSMVPTFYWPVKIEFPGVLALDVYAGFTAGLDNVGLGLLGQNGFFDRAKVLFDHKAGLFHVEFESTGT